jgi:hypothetical protein
MHERNASRMRMYFDILKVLNSKGPEATLRKRELELKLVGGSNG